MPECSWAIIHSQLWYARCCYQACETVWWKPAPYTSVGIAFLTFAGIVIFHIYIPIKKCNIYSVVIISYTIETTTVTEIITLTIQKMYGASPRLIQLLHNTLKLVFKNCTHHLICFHTITWTLKMHSNHYKLFKNRTLLPFSELFSWAEIFMKSSIRPPELNL